MYNEQALGNEIKQTTALKIFQVLANTVLEQRKPLEMNLYPKQRFYIFINQDSGSSAQACRIERPRYKYDREYPLAGRVARLRRLVTHSFNATRKRMFSSNRKTRR